jgi:hypothetical protein
VSQSHSPFVDELLAERRAEAEREELAELSFWAAVDMLNAERWDRQVVLEKTLATSRVDNHEGGDPATDTHEGGESRRHTQ